MSPTLHPVVGTIRLEPRQSIAAAGPCNDLTLDQLFASFAQDEMLGDPEAAEDNMLRVVSSCRLSWRRSDIDAVAMRADLSQLLADLAAEFERVSGMAS
jgi:hypothetical protein